MVLGLRFALFSGLRAVQLGVPCLVALKGLKGMITGLEHIFRAATYFKEPANKR